MVTEIWLKYKFSLLYLVNLMFDEKQQALNPSQDITRETSSLKHPSKEEDTPISYTLYKYRHVELALYCLGAALN